jgi:hypothetical protein
MVFAKILRYASYSRPLKIWAIRSQKSSAKPKRFAAIYAEKYPHLGGNFSFARKALMFLASG